MMEANHIVPDVYPVGQLGPAGQVFAKSSCVDKITSHRRVGKTLLNGPHPDDNVGSRANCLGWFLCVQVGECADGHVWKLLPDDICHLVDEVDHRGALAALLFVERLALEAFARTAKPVHLRDR